jgi:carbonic anhydrase
MLPRRLSSLALAFSALAFAGESPVNITSTDSFFAALPPLNFAYSANTHINVLDTGSPDHEASIKANIDSGSTLTLSGIVYNLLQFHFHTEAEHLINGFTYPMEMHLVHQEQGMTGTDGLLVVGRFIEIGPVDNPDLTGIFNDLPAIHAAGAAGKDINSFDLNPLLPGSLGTWRYEGSLTTAPFAGPVLWSVLETPMSLSQAQVDAFRLLFDHGNSREVQDLNGQLIQTDIAGFAVPEPGTWGLMVLGGLLLFHRKTTRFRPILRQNEVFLLPKTP